VQKVVGTGYMVHLFGKIGAGQWLRYLIGVLEFAGAVGVLIPGAVRAGRSRADRPDGRRHRYQPADRLQPGGPGRVPDPQCAGRVGSPPQNGTACRTRPPARAAYSSPCAGPDPGGLVRDADGTAMTTPTESSEPQQHSAGAPGDVPAARPAALERLAVLIGTWDMEARFEADYFAPGTPAFTARGGRTVFEWLAGQFFLLQRFTAGSPAAPSGLAVIAAATGDADTFTQHYYDSVASPVSVR